MASTFSELKFELIGTGDQAGNWGVTTNDNIGTAIEQAITGLGNPVFTSDANLVISLTDTVALQTARALVLNTTSTVSLTTSRDLVVPTIEKQYIVHNNTTGGQAITVKTPSGTGVSVPNGAKMHLYVDGVNVIDAVSHFTSLTLGSALSIANGGTGQTTRQNAMDALAGSVTTGEYLRGNGTDVVMSTIQVSDVPTLNQNTTGTAANVTGTVAIANGGTGETNRQAAIDALAGSVTSGQYLRGNGTDVVMSTIQVSDVPTLNQNTTGTAANVTGTVAIANGGTGETTRQAAIDALAGAVTSGQYLRGNGTDVVMSAIQAADVPTLNQNTTGTAANVTGTVAIANGGTGETTRQAAIDALAGAVTSGQYLRGNGTDVVMSAIQAADVPTLNQNTTGTAANVTGTVAVANGGTGATTAANARTSLSAAASGANTDITSVALTTGKITTAPTANTDIVNKEYADAIASGIHFHEAVDLATTAALPANTYNNGSSGVGATLTANANGALSVDSTLTVVGNRILVKNEANGSRNGVYVVTQVGSAGTPYILTRATDFDSVGTGVDQIDEGDFFLVTSGTANVNTAWVQQTPPPITIGTTAIVFQQFSAPITYTAGTGLSESPTYTFNIANTGTAGTYGSASQVPVFVTNAQGQVTSVTNTAISIPNSATTATNLNTASAIVARDASGNFSAGTITATLSGNATNVTGTVAIANGGSGTTTAQGAMNAFAGAVTSGSYLRGNGTNVVMSAIQVADVPTLNQNTTGTAANVTGTVAVANGGTGNTTAQAEMNRVAQAVTSGQYLRGNGTNVVMSAIQAADVPTLNQNTAGTAANVTGVVAVANGGTGTATPSLVAGTNVTITGTWPNQTIAASGGGGGGGDVTGPASSTTNGIVLFNSTTGKVIRDAASQDGLIHGLTVGRGTGSISSNTTFGALALTANTTGTFNTAIGADALRFTTIGTQNTGVGVNALRANTTGIRNTAVGAFALNANTIGDELVAVGREALFNNTTGARNTAVGEGALHGNSTGIENTAVGSGALRANTVGTSNTAVGRSALANVGTTANNTAVGHQALFNNTAAANTAVGQNALFTNTTGIQNDAHGFQALQFNSTGSNNTAVGFNAARTNTVSSITAIGTNALQANSTGTGNTAVGANALQGNTIGTNNVAVGQNALFAMTTGNGNTAVGFIALQNTVSANNNTAVGASSLPNNTTGSNNTAVGNSSLSNNTTGVDNTAVGSSALSLTGTGINNTGIGKSALSVNQTGSNNTAVGFEAASQHVAGAVTAIGSRALRLSTGTGNTAVGTSALQVNTTGINNTAVGFEALQAQTTGTRNTAVGAFALFNNTFATQNTAVGVSALQATTIGGNNTAVGNSALLANTTGSSNTAVGSSALTANTTGINNVAVGEQALSTNTTGTGNVAVGQGALAFNGNGVNNVAVGRSALLQCTATAGTNTAVGDAALSSTTGGSNNTGIGNGASAATATTSNSITLGNSSINSLRCQTTTITALSDVRDKTNIVDIPAGLSFVQALRPVAFDWNMRDGAKVGVREFGFIAQELQEVQAATGITVPNLVMDANPEKLEASSGTLLPVLVKAIQELKAEFEAYKLSHP